ncbi:MAG: DUF4230 domain-containing protein [Longicatena caecimuris]
MKLGENIRNTKKTITSILFLMLIIALIFFAGMKFADRNSEPEISSTALAQQLQEVNELAVLDYNYTKVGKFENSLKLNGWSIPLTKKSFLLTYAGRIQAGVDMSAMEVNMKGKKILVSLPEVRILNNVLDEKSIEVYDETKNIFNPISINDYKTFAAKQKERVEDEAIENGLLSEAATKAQSTIRKFLQMIPEIKDDYTIEVTF